MGWTLVNESCPPANSVVDPGERVAVSLNVMNNGMGSTTNLVTTNVALSCVGGNVQADITLQNQGIVSATGVTLTQAQLGSPAVGGALEPQGPFTLAPGAAQNFTVTFATACPFTGTELLRIKGASTNAGSWGSTSGVTSP